MFEEWHWLSYAAGAVTIALGYVLYAIVLPLAVRAISGLRGRAQSAVQAVRRVRHALHEKPAPKRQGEDVPWDYTTMEDRRVQIDGSLLKLAREMHGISAGDFADQFGHSDAWLWQIEHESNDPYWHDVRLFAEKLGVKQSELLRDGVPSCHLTDLPPPPGDCVWLDGARLRCHRWKHQWTQEQAAYRIDRNKHHYRVIENMIGPAEVEVAAAICILFGITLKQVVIPVD